MARTILIVDDSAFELDLLTDFLKNKYSVLTAASGKELLAMLRESAKSVSAILLDLVMPEMDGFEALRRLRENAIYRQIPVIASTGLTDESSQVRAMALGANGYVFKPFNQELLIYTLENAINLREKSALINTFRKDALTGLPNRTSFFETAEAMIRRKPAGYYILSCFDVENFKVINDQYGISAGDDLLKRIADAIQQGVQQLSGACCRYSADKFGLLYPASLKDSETLSNLRNQVITTSHNGRRIKIRIGRYLVDDLTVPISAMYDRATLAEESIRGRYDTYVAEYTDSMRTHLLSEQRIVNDMDAALANGEFEAWLQPQYNHATGALIGAEALARWKRDGQYISPAEFVPVFERNGFIYEMDQYIWEQVCKLLRRWLDEGRDPLPISVNISRRDLFHQHMIEKLTNLLKKYDIPYPLLRLEVTESAFSESSGQIVSKVDELIRLGFVLEIDDFGSGYSSLNTLKDVPASILKLDMKFFENARNQQRGGNIVESVVRMAKWLGMAIIAEGVEDQAQADYLKSIGCYYIQGYFYAKPMPVADYEKLLDAGARESELTRLKTLKTLDNNEFWNPKSMETLIFNSYVGGACIFEYHDHHTELLRINEQYARELGGLVCDGAELKNASMVHFLDDENREALHVTICKAIDEQKQASCEVRLVSQTHVEFVRATVRMIARTAEHYLLYCVIVNVTQQRQAEQSALNASERVQAVMDNSQCGITAVVAHEEGSIEFLFINNRFYQMFGYTREQFDREIADPFGNIVPEDYQRVVDAARQLRTVGQTLTLQMRARRRDQRVIWLRVDISIVHFANVPAPVQLSNFMDITDQVQAEKKQLESARKLEVIMSNVNGGVSAIQIHDDGTSHFIFNNERYYELYGYTTEQARAANLDVMTTILPEDFPAVMEKVKKLKADGVPAIIDYRITKHGGQLAYLRANSSLMRMEGYGEVITSVVTDITEKRALEEQLRAIVDNINGGVTATVVEHGRPRFVVVNEQYFRMLGYTTREAFEADGIDKYAGLHPEDRARIVRQFESRDGGKSRYTMEYRIIRKDGAIRYIQNNISVIHLIGEDEPVQLSVANDVTDLRLAQQKERELALRLQTIMSSIHSGVSASLYHDKEHVEVVFSNDSFYQLYGYTREQLAAEGLTLLELIIPEDREKTMETVARIVKTRGSETYEYRCRKRDGSLIWIQCTNSVVSMEAVGDTVLLAVTTDITDLRAAQRQQSETADKLSAVLNHTGEGITAIALHGEHPEFLFANDQYFAIVGCTREGYAAQTHEDMFALVHPADREALRAQVTELNHGAGSLNARYRVLRPDGNTVCIRSAITITRLTGIDVPVQIATFSDVSEEQEASEQLAFLNDSAHDILAQPDSEQAIRDTLRNLLAYFSADRGYVVELDHARHVSRNTYEVCAEGVSPQADALQDIPFDTAAGWFKVLSHNQYFVIRDVSRLREDEAPLRQMLAAQGIRSIILAPLWRDGTLIGFAGVDNPVRAIEQTDRLTALADYIAVLLTRRDLSRKIQQDNATMQQLINDTPGGFVRMALRPDGPPAVVRINQGICRLLDMTYDDVMAEFGQNATRCIAAEDVAAITAVGANALTSGGQFTSKCRLRRGDGSLMWTMVFGRFTKDEENRQYLNAYFTDITGQIETERQHKDLLDHLPCGAVLFDLNGQAITVAYRNQRYREMVGQFASGQPGSSTLADVHPDDLPRIRQVILSGTDTNTTCDIRIRHTDGSYHPYRVNSRRLRRDNAQLSCCVTLLPLPDGQLSMQQMMPYLFPAMMESSTDITFAKDKEYRYLCCSHAYARLLGLEDEKAVVGKTDYELFSSAIAARFRDDDIRLVAGGKPIIDQTETIPAAGGLPHYTRMSKYLLRDAAGSILGIYGIGRDITERQETSDQLKLLTNSLPGGLATFACSQAETRLEYCNDGFCRLFGFPRAELPSSMATVKAQIFSEDQSIIDTQMNLLIETGAPVDGTYRIHVGGGYKWVNHKAIVVDRAGDSVIINAVFLDVTELQEEKERLRVSEELNRLAIEHSGNIITRFDVATRTLTLPDALNPIFVLPQVLHNMPQEQIALGRVSPDTAYIYTELFEGILRGQATGTATYKQNSTKGWRWLEAQYTTIFSDAGQPVTAVISFSDITEKLEKEVVYNKWQQSLHERPADSYTLFRCNLSKGTSYDSWEGQLLHVDFSSDSRTFDERTAEYAQQCVYAEDKAMYLAFMRADALLAAYYRGHRTDTLEYRELDAQGTVRWLRLTVDLVEYPSSRDVEAYLMYEDIDEQKKADLLTLERSETDALTGILNRATFIERMEEALRVSPPGQQHALLMLDVDNFKHINDTLGHGAGDQVLRRLTAQMSAILRRDDLIGRLGGDEFFIFLKNIPGDTVAAAKARQICALHIQAQGADIAATASIGIAMIPRDGSDFDTLYKKVDHTLYQQKQQGKNGFLFVSP